MSSPSREFLTERDFKIFQAARNGVSRNVIARQFGLSVPSVGAAIKRQIARMNKEALVAAPDLIRMELERLDALMAGVWPYTQPTRFTLPDGTSEIIPPDVKYVTEARNIIKDRIKLLGLEQTHISLTVEAEPVKSSLAGATAAEVIDASDPRIEALKMLEIMGESGILDRELIDRLTGEQPALEAPQMKSLAEIEAELGPEEEHVG